MSGDWALAMQAIPKRKAAIKKGVDLNIALEAPSSTLHPESILTFIPTRECEEGFPQARFPGSAYAAVR